jgi:hypothetical protein
MEGTFTAHAAACILSASIWIITGKLASPGIADEMTDITVI